MESGVEGSDSGSKSGYSLPTTMFYPSDSLQKPRPLSFSMSHVLSTLPCFLVVSLTCFSVTCCISLKWAPFDLSLLYFFGSSSHLWELLCFTSPLSTWSLNISFLWAGDWWTNSDVLWTFWLSILITSIIKLSISNAAVLWASSHRLSCWVHIRAGWEGYSLPIYYLRYPAAPGSRLPEITMSRS